MTGQQFPKNVGIIAIEVYFPHRYIEQTELGMWEITAEQHDNVSPGKYTIGLGQQQMGFCNDREDINSIALTVVRRLMEKYLVDYKNIGRLEVGTETVVDKSKSVKTHLMDLFAAYGNTEIEGVTCTNACYGGTAALFNAVHWIESSYWDGRLAIVVAADIAVYAMGPARPTSGAGAVAMLVGANAPIVMERCRGTYMANVYDFYKPVLSSEYPHVDGKLSVECFLDALDQCSLKYLEHLKVQTTLTNYADFLVFHSPYAKIVEKAVNRMAKNDNTSAHVSELFAKKTEPSLLTCRRIGNMYCASLYSALASLIASNVDLIDKRILMFSYGSGLAASMFSLIVKSSVAHIGQDLLLNLKERIKCSPEEFEKLMEVNSKNHNAANYYPCGEIYNGMYYLEFIDSKYRRKYLYQPVD